MMMFGNDEGSESDDDDGPALPPSFPPLSLSLSLKAPRSSEQLSGSMNPETAVNLR